MSSNMEKTFEDEKGRETHTRVFLFRLIYIYLYYLGYDREAITCVWAPGKEKKRERERERKKNERC